MPGRVNALAALDGIAMFNRVGLPVIGRDHDDLRVENITDLVPDQVINGLDIETRRQALLDTGDDRQLGLTLGEFLLQF